jgi:hypothetical protein
VRALAFAVLLVACKGADAPEARCEDKCTAKVASNCSSKQCARGCAFILDRIVEREDDNVLACVGKAKGCDDPTWAECAVAVGVHASGAPPTNVQSIAPAPDKSDDE